MEKKTISVKSIAVGTKKDGSTISGVTSRGSTWTLWHIVDGVGEKYGIFMYGDDKPEYKIDGQYEIEYEEETKGEYTNRTIRPQSKRTGGVSASIVEIKEMFAKIMKDLEWIKVRVELNSEDINPKKEKTVAKEEIPF